MTTPGPAAYRPFGVRLREAMATHGPLCAGVDPHRGLVESWGLAYDLSGLERFAMTCVEAFAGDVASVKPQSAFFEVFGARGVAVLERAVDAFTEAGTIVILDAKRGDIGSTMDAYAEAFLGKDAPSPADAVTVSPYLGGDSVAPFLADAAHGAFLLCHTSNPGAADLQHLEIEGRPLYLHLAALARGWNTQGNLGLVVGATYPEALERVRAAAPELPFLVPGIGAQGGDLEASVRAGLDALGRGLLISSSREIIFAADPRAAALRTRDAIDRARG